MKSLTELTNKTFPELELLEYITDHVMTNYSKYHGLAVYIQLKKASEGRSEVTEVLEFTGHEMLFNYHDEFRAGLGCIVVHAKWVEYIVVGLAGNYFNSRNDLWPTYFSTSHVNPQTEDRTLFTREDLNKAFHELGSLLQESSGKRSA